MSIHCKAVSLSYGEFKVLNNIDLAVRSGTVHALLGRNGSGKSSLFSILLGLVQADSGQVFIGGKPWSRDLLREIGASINGPAFYPHLSAKKNLQVHARLLGLPDSEIDRALSQVGLSDAGNKKARNFSTGMKARLALAQAMLGDPEILILDEPQNGLDPQGIANLRNLLRSWAKHGGTVLVSSHQLGEVVQLADDASVLAGGKIRYSGPLKSLAPAGELENEFFRLTQEVQP